MRRRREKKRQHEGGPREPTSLYRGEGRGSWSGGFMWLGPNCGGEGKDGWEEGQRLLTLNFEC
jgi:hypothetical protein